MDGFSSSSHKSFYKKQKLIVLIVALIITAFSLFVANTETACAYNKISASIVLNAANAEVMYENNSKVKMEMASTTKILTAITVIENCDVFSYYKIPKQAEGVEGSSIYLKAGQNWRIMDLLYGLMLRSGNDCATALAYVTSGSIEAFCALMNQTAVKAGATNSNFANPHGLHDDNHYTTAYDLAMITAYSLNNQLFARIVSTKKHSFTDENGQNVTFCNKNKMLYGYEGANGVKTGYTTQSGRCLVSSASRDGVQLICVVLNVYDTYGVTISLFDKSFADCKKRLNTKEWYQRYYEG